MILVGNQRSGARDLAVHLVKEENDHVHIHELRGFVANDLMGAFKEAETLSKGTKCRQYLYSLSLNPPQNENVSTKSFEKAIDRAEDRLGLNGQPRAIVFHEKEGRRHAHVVWSRIDIQKMKAVQLSHSKRKLNALSKQLYLDHGWRLPAGHVDKTLSDPSSFTLEDWQQAKRTGSDPRKVKEVIQKAWHDTPTAAEFEKALKRQGYTLAKGDQRGFVVVDRFGEVRSLARQLKIKTKALKERFGDNATFKPVSDVQAEIKDTMSKRLSDFAVQLDAKTQAIKTEFKTKLTEMRSRQRKERLALSNKQARCSAREAQDRQSRFRKGLKGAWDVLRGEHFRISQKNKLEATLTIEHHQKERDGLIQDHLKQRQKLNKDKTKTIEKVSKLRRQRHDIQKEIKNHSARLIHKNEFRRDKLSL